MRSWIASARHIPSIGRAVALCQTWFDGITGRHVVSTSRNSGRSFLWLRRRPGRGSRGDRHGQPNTGRGQRSAWRRPTCAWPQCVRLSQRDCIDRCSGTTGSDFQRQNAADAIGEKTELTLDKFVFNPAARRGRIGVRVSGAFRFLSGQVSKLARSDVKVTTPFAAIGIRGTEFWGGPIDDQALGVFLIEGTVSVSNAAGEQILSQPGQGTNIATPGAAPGPVTFWPPDKVNRAIATVTFQ